MSTSSKIWVQIIDLQTEIPGENYFRDLGYTKVGQTLSNSVSRKINNSNTIQNHFFT